MVSKLLNERKKRKEEMFKRVIGQKDINNFFIKPKSDDSQNPENNFEQNDCSEEEDYDQESVEINR